MLREEELSESSKIQKALLAEYSQEVKGLIRSTLMSAVRIGEILKDVRDNILVHGEWLTWVETEFDKSINRDTAVNFINLHDLYSEYKDTHPKGLENLSLSSLYIISRRSVNSEVRRAVLEIAEEDEAPNREEVRAIVQSFRRIKVAEAGLPETVAELEVAENPQELQRLQRLSKKNQTEVVSRLQEGLAKTTKEAIKQIHRERVVEAEAENADKVEVDYTDFKKIRAKKLQDVPKESVNLAFIEAPLKMNYVTNELHDLCKELERVLVPSGYAIITVGHKAAMFAGAEIEPLKAVHLLCLRRQPGNSRAIVGTNIMSASVFAVFCYKPPYRAPSEMLADLHTYDLVTDSEALVGMDEVYSGIEKCLKHMFNPLVHTGDTIMHHPVSNLHFDLASFMEDVAKDVGALKLYSVRN